jgi:hypothetical protein
MVIFPKTLILFAIRIPKCPKTLFLPMNKLPSINLSRLEHISPMPVHKILLPLAKVQILRREDIHTDTMSLLTINISTINLILRNHGNLTKIKAMVAVLFSNPVLIHNYMGEFVEQELFESGLDLYVLETEKF